MSSLDLTSNSLITSSIGDQIFINHKTFGSLCVQSNSFEILEDFRNNRINKILE